MGYWGIEVLGRTHRTSSMWQSRVPPLAEASASVWPGRGMSGGVGCATTPIVLVIARSRCDKVATGRRGNPLAMKSLLNVTYSLTFTAAHRCTGSLSSTRAFHSLGIASRARAGPALRFAMTCVGNDVGRIGILEH